MAETGRETGKPLPVDPDATDRSVSLDDLRAAFHAQTARIRWRELQTHYARGAVILVSPDLNLVEVAVQLRQDNKIQFEQWIAEGAITGISDQQGRAYFDENPLLWAVVAAPWVLVQPGG